MERPDVEGKKIFLLRPHSVIQQDMLDILIMAGYETYTLLDEKKARKLLVKFPGSIMFINIDEGHKEPEWESYIRAILTDEESKGSRLGIMSYNQDKDLMRKYLMDLTLPCGYIQLKLGLEESAKIMLTALEANEARGRRKCIRADCADDLSATVNYKGDSGVYRGKILDISSAGIAAHFDTFGSFAANSVLPGVQLKLRGGLLLADMIFMGKRNDKQNVYVLLFAPGSLKENKLVVYRYVKTCLQKYIDTVKV